MDRSAIDVEAIRDFYDDFLTSRMVEYRLSRNLRIERAISRVLSYSRSDSRVLDIGCGIGVVAERVAKFASRGHVYACDLSERNIWYANQTIRLPNLTFKVVDAVHDLEAIQAWVGDRIDLVVLIDVLEHLPVTMHAEVFRAVREWLAEDGTVVLTFPSPAYQRFLKANDEHALQIIDEVIELPHIVAVCSDAGLFMKHYSVEDIWMKNQYVHCVFQSTGDVKPIAKVGASLPVRVLSKAALGARSVWQHQFVRPWLRRKYVSRVFGSGYQSASRATRPQDT